MDSADGTSTGKGLNASHTLLFKPTQVAVDPSNGDVYVSDGYGNKRVGVFDREGHYLRQWGRQGTQAETDADRSPYKLGKYSRHGGRDRLFTRPGPEVHVCRQRLR